jgi:hypothetical protein
MENTPYLVRHGLYFAIMVALPLLALALLSGGLARRRGLESVVFGGRGTLRAVLLIGLCGMGGQFLFHALTRAHCASEAARMIGLAAASGAAAWAAAPLISYFSRWKGVLYGALAAIPATLLYQRLYLVREWEARAAVAATLTACIALAITYPIPQQAEAVEEEAEADSIMSERLPLQPGGLICPTQVTVQPASVVINPPLRAKHRRNR